MSNSEHHCIREWAVFAVFPGDRKSRLMVYPWTSDVEAARQFYAKADVRKTWHSLVVVCREQMEVLTMIEEWSGRAEAGSPR